MPSAPANPTYLVTSNVPTDRADEIAKALLSKRVAACVTLSPVKSVYRWDGSLCIDQEVTLTAKVSESRVEDCVKAVTRLHPYDLPEVLVCPVDPHRSSQAYQDWVSSECTSIQTKSEP